jgi:hypothetical protein
MNKQNEITSPVKLLDDKGKVLVTGWARHNHFDYDRKHAKPRWRLKEWDFHQISNGKIMVQVNFFNITVASMLSAKVIDVTNGKVIADTGIIHLFTKNRFLLPLKGDVPNFFRYAGKKGTVEFLTRKDHRHITFEGKYNNAPFNINLRMDIMEDHENITIVTPFKDMPTRFFMTTKQNCMPCEGTVQIGAEKIEFSKDDTFAVMDWGRGVWPHANEWYWGNGATYLEGKDGKKHIFGFEITWMIGDETNATETCLFYDGKAHKIGAVDVEEFPGTKGWMQPWLVTCEDGSFDMSLSPACDNHTGGMMF